MAPLIQFQNITKRFNHQTVLQAVNLSIEQGESVVLLGPSGSGKSVLLRLLANLDQPDQGQISLSAKGNGLHRPVMAMVFQQSALFDTMTVKQNLEFAWQRLRYNGSQPYPLGELLSKLSLSKSDLNKRPAHLSGGMSKRAALARALIARPQLLLYDEPTTGLDPVTAEQIAQLIRQFHQPGTQAITSLTVTHDYRAAAWIADRILYLDAGEHQIKELMNRAEIDQICHQALKHEAKATPISNHRPDSNDNRGQAITILTEVLESKAKSLDIFARPSRPTQSRRSNPLHRFVTRPLKVILELLKTLAGLRPPGDLKNFALRLLDFGLGSIPYIAGSGFLVGVAMATLLAPVLSNFGVTQQLPGLLTTALLREIAPLLTALLLAGRFGASIAAELGAMVVTEQLDALRTFKETPERYLLTPIVQAILLLQPLLTLLFIAAGLSGGYLYVTLESLVRPRVYEYGILAAWGDIGISIILIKSLVFGAIIALTGYQIGKTTGRSASEVGRSSRSAVVYASMFIITANLVINQLLA